MPAKPLSAEALGLPEFDPGPASDGAGGGDGVFSLESHARARAALEFALSVNDIGFNVFVLGPDRSGRMTSTLEFLNSHIQDRPVPHDWVFLNNFRRPHRPKPYALPPGKGRALRDRMESLVPQLREALSKAIGGEEYQSAVESEGAALRERIGEQIEALRKEARTHGLDIVQTQQGMMVVAVDDKGEALTPDKIPEDKREEVEARGREIAERVNAVTREAGRMQAEFAERMGERTRETAAAAIDSLIDALARDFGEYRGIARWIVEMRVDIVENLTNFQPLPPERRPPGWQPPERRYAVNLFVDHGEDKHPSVVVEPNPTYQNLFGSIEYHQQNGLLETDFSMLRAGSLHRANGGILVLRAEALAAAGPSWQFLKGALRDGEIRVEELYRYGGVPIAGAPRPKPIPLDVKVVIVGSPTWYYTFFSADPEFQAYFKIKADIDADMDAGPGNLATYAGMIRRMAKKAAPQGCDEGAVRRLLGIASRWAAQRDKLTAQFERIEDVLTEAAQLVPAPGPITAEAVDRALVQRRERNDRVEDRMQDNIRRGTIMIATEGEAIGQINGLTVRDMGDHAFGGPSRITARASIGRRGVINIERDVAMGGPIQQKGAMVIQGFLAGRFARRHPLSFDVSITFEQSYGGVEGDSASLAELLAILSDLADAPIRQGLAITGSVNQRGDAQAIGGAHFKIEGFFRACREAGELTGDQGIVVPASNEENLVLHDDVAEAVAAGKFHIWSISRIEDAFPLFMGLEAGEPDAKGAFPPDSLYGRVAARLDEFDRILMERERAAEL